MNIQKNNTDIKDKDNINNNKYNTDNNNINNINEILLIIKYIDTKISLIENKQKIKNEDIFFTTKIVLYFLSLINTILVVMIFVLRKKIF